MSYSDPDYAPQTTEAHLEYLAVNAERKKALAQRCVDAYVSAIRACASVPSASIFGCANARVAEALKNAEWAPCRETLKSMFKPTPIVAAHAAVDSCADTANELVKAMARGSKGGAAAPAIVDTLNAADACRAAAIARLLDAVVDAADDIKETVAWRA